MALIIRSAFGLFWLVMTSSLVYLIYGALQAESSPQKIWAWFVFCAFAFISVTWLTYNVVFAHHNSNSQQ